MSIAEKAFFPQIAIFIAGWWILPVHKNNHTEKFGYFVIKFFYFSAKMSLVIPG